MKSRILKVAKYLTLLVAAAAAGWFLPGDATPKWQTARTSDFDLHFGRGLDSDARELVAFLKTAYARIADEFRAHRPDDLLEGVELDVYLHPEPGQLASEQHATMRSNLRKNGYKAEIHMLTLAAYSDGAGKPSERDKDYVFRQVVHEVAAVHVQRLILGKPTGWRYDQAAPWFLQGYDEYLSGIYGRRSQDKTLKAYRDRIRFDRDRVRFKNGIQVRNPYSDGAVLVKFLHDSFGRDAVQNIWLSPEPTFELALLKTLGTDYADLESRWHTWQATD